MERSREELIELIEAARTRLNRSIDESLDYELVYQCSVELDRLIERYIEAGY